MGVAPLPRAGVLVHSSLCAGLEDAEGGEVTLFRRPAGDSAVFTRMEGPIMAPLFAYGPNVKIDDRTGRISLRFLDPELGKAGEYLLDGMITGQAMDVSSNISGQLKLPRLQVFAPKLPRCKR